MKITTPTNCRGMCNLQATCAPGKYVARSTLILIVPLHKPQVTCIVSCLAYQNGRQRSGVGVAFWALDICMSQPHLHRDNFVLHQKIWPSLEIRQAEGWEQMCQLLVMMNPRAYQVRNGPGSSKKAVRMRQSWQSWRESQVVPLAGKRKGSV